MLFILMVEKCSYKRSYLKIPVMEVLLSSLNDLTGMILLQRELYTGLGREVQV